METQELLTADELAQKLKVTAATVANWRHRGVIPSIQINASTIRYSFPMYLRQSVRAPRRRPPPGRIASEHTRESQPERIGDILHRAFPDLFQANGLPRVARKRLTWKNFSSLRLRPAEKQA